VRSHPAEAVTELIDVSVVAVAAGVFPIVGLPLRLGAGPGGVTDDADDLQAARAETIHDRVVFLVKRRGVPAVRTASEIDAHPTGAGLRKSIGDGVGD
jgi:hypothetical protein